MANISREPTPQILQKLGIDCLPRNPFTKELIKSWYYRCFEEQCKLWEFSYKKKLLIDKGVESGGEINDYKEEEKKIIVNIQNWFVAVIWLRTLYFKEMLKSERRQIEVIEECKNDIDYWITWWVWTHDPRAETMGLPARQPLILFPKQEEILSSMSAWYENRMSGLIEKSREEGISWITCAFFANHFLFDKSFTGMLISQKADNVDKVGSNLPLFGKIRHILYNQPAWMLPEGMRTKRNAFDNQMKIVHPKTSSELVGAIGDNPGTSARASAIMVDEAQDIEHFQELERSIGSTSNCTIYIGTSKGLNAFGQKRLSGNVSVRTIMWYQDPRKNELWKENKINYNAWWWKFINLQEDSVSIAQNYMCDYSASVEGSVIKAEWVQAAVNFIQEDKATGHVVAGFDVSTGRYNKAVYISRKGVVVRRSKDSPLKTVIEGAWWAIDRAEEDGVEEFFYDGDGVGESLLHLYKMSDRKIQFRIRDVHGGERASDRIVSERGKKGYELYDNRRAEVWCGLKRRFEKTFRHVSGKQFYPLDELISIPDDYDLMMQLSQPKETRAASGKIKIESKQQMKSRGIMSPDKADALAYSFWESDNSVVSNDFEYYGTSNNIFEGTPDFEHMSGRNFVSIYIEESMATSAICALWREVTQSLIVYGEIEASMESPEDIIESLKSTADEGKAHIHEWVANAEVFNDLDRQGLWNAYRKTGIALRKNYTSDMRGDILTMNSMIKKNILKVSDKCPQLIYQLSYWDKDKKGEPDKSYGLALALSQMVSRLRINNIINPQKVEAIPIGGK